MGVHFWRLTKAHNRTTRMKLICLFAALASAVPVDFGGAQGALTPQLKKSINAFRRKASNKAIGGAQALANQHGITVNVRELANKVTKTGQAQAEIFNKQVQRQKHSPKVVEARQQIQAVQAQGKQVASQYMNSDKNMNQVTGALKKAGKEQLKKNSMLNTDLGDLAKQAANMAKAQAQRNGVPLTQKQASLKANRKLNQAINNLSQKLN